MSVFERLRTWLRQEDAGAPPSSAAGPRRGEGEPGQGAAANPEDAEPAGDPDQETASRRLFAPLERLGARGGPSVEQAIALLREARATAGEAAAVAAAMRATTLPEPVRVACADILATRGDDRGALGLLAGATSSAGLVLAADLFAASGQLARAVGTIERVLARELGAPGALERHQRWRAALGYDPRPARRLDEATVVAPSAVGGPFRLVREVARGGAGVVYEADDEVLGRRVAFKVYHGRGADRGQLEREVRIAVGLSGPGIMRVFDASPEAGWVALEWIAHGSVRDALLRRDLAALAPVGPWARPLARALARVHAGGFVHGDVKPANVLLRQPGDPVLGDFGIARPLGAPGGGGSPGYLSPERLAGRASHPKDNVYGYGRVLEDVIHRLDEDGPGGAVAGGDRAAWRELSLACIGLDEDRPADGESLLRRVEGIR